MRQLTPQSRSISQPKNVPSAPKGSVSSTSSRDATGKMKRYFNPADRIDVYENRYWHKANLVAKKVVSYEPEVLESGEPVTFKPLENVEKAYDFVMQRYLEYVLVLKMLTHSMKRLLHPQKRLLFKRFIKAVACRVCELKSEMIKLSSINIHNLLGCYPDLGMTPEDLEYNIPPSIAQDSIEAIRVRERQLTLLLNSLENKPDINLKEMVELYLTNANVERIRSKRFSIDSNPYTPQRDSRDQLREIRSTTRTAASASRLVKYRSASGSQDAGSSTAVLRRRYNAGYGTPGSRPSSSMFIPKKMSSSMSEVDNFVNEFHYQKMVNDPDFPRRVGLLYRQWILWLGRRTYQKTKESYENFINMNLQADGPKTMVLSGMTKATVAELGQLQQERDEEYQDCLGSLSQEYPNTSEGGFDLWALHLNLRQWVLELRDLLGKCGPYPDEQAGGCQALFTNKTVAEVAAELENFEDNDKKKKGTKKDTKDKDKDKDKKAKKKDEKGDGKKKKEVKEEFLWTMPRSVAIPEMVKVLDQYTQYWNSKLEVDNLQQHADLQLARETVRAEAEENMRKVMDAMMLTELDRMRAIDREPRKSYKKGKTKGKGAKKRGKKDPLKNQTIEELYAELVMAGIVIRPQQVTLDDYIGAPNLSDTRRDIYRLATPHDIKIAMREMFGLPLCSNLIHSSVELRKSMLLAGPPGVGKTMLVNGLCRETGANLFDLSPVSMVGKYQGKKQETYLLNVLLKVAKTMEPTIIVVENCHLLFPTKKAKKIPEVTKDKPARWVRLLSRLMKKVVAGDRILLVGVTNDPFKAKTGAMCKLFENQFLVPFPEYGTRLALWTQHLIPLRLARPHNLNISILTKMTEGFTGQDIKKVISKVCTSSRQASKRRLRNSEFLPVLAAEHPDDEAPSLADWITWYLTTPLMAARKALIDGLVESEEAAAAAANKKK